MKIILDGKPHTVALGKNVQTGGQLMRQMGISPQEALLKVDGKVRPDTIAITNKSRIEIIRVVFGG